MQARGRPETLAAEEQEVILEHQVHEANCIENLTKIEQKPIFKYSTVTEFVTKYQPPRSVRRGKLVESGGGGQQEDVCTKAFVHSHVDDLAGRHTFIVLCIDCLEGLT